jgi:glycerol-3-phosphate dehydrogenase
MTDAHGRITGCIIEDLVNATVLRVTAHVTVNATGVWTDEIRRLFGFTEQHLRPSRGSHLVLPADHIPLRAALTVPSPDDGRPVFLIPHREGTLVGTTDLYHSGDLDDPRPSRTEVDYLLRTVNAAFPTTDTALEHVRGAFAGLRPILDTYADDPSEASREEDIWYERGLLSVAGGKLTTWRATAEEAVDAVIERLPERRSRHAEPCATKGTPLAGLAPTDLSERLTIAHGLTPAVAEGMAHRLGSLAWIACGLSSRPRDLQPLAEGCDLTAAEVRTHLRYSAVVHLEDLLLRRARIGLWNPQLAVALLPRLRPLLRSELGWKAERISNEEARLVDRLNGWTIDGIRELER